MVAAKSKKAPAAATPKGTQATVKPKGLPAKTKIITIKPKSAISKTPEALKDKKKVAQKGKTPPPPGGTESKPKTTTLKPAKARAKTKMKAPEDKTVAASTKTAKELKTVQTQKAYNPLGKLDPFQPLFKEKPAVTQVKRKIKKRTPRTPLEKIAISQLKLVGIVLAPSGNKALVQEASGKGYIIKKGTYIGLNSGKVVDIQKNNVIIKEEVEDVLGKVIVRKKEIRLPKPIGE
jgi:type IV pilus assembly protein PilP